MQVLVHVPALHLTSLSAASLSEAPKDDDVGRIPIASRHGNL